MLQLICLRVLPDNSLLSLPPLLPSATVHTCRNTTGCSVWTQAHLQADCFNARRSQRSKSQQPSNSSSSSARAACGISRQGPWPLSSRGSSSSPVVRPL